MENSEMPVMYYWTIYSGEWMDGGETDKLMEIVEDLKKIDRRRLVSPTMRLCVRYKYDDGYFTITPFFENGRWKFHGDSKDSCSQNWIISELNKMFK